MWATMASAQQESCEGYDNVQFSAAVNTAKAAMATADLATMSTTLAEAKDKLRCLEELVDRSVYADFARYMALTAFFDQDETVSIQWGLASRYADPKLAWGDTFAEDHPFRELLTTTEDSPLSVREGEALAIPRKGGVFASGVLIFEPKLHAEVPYLLQLVDKDGSVVSAEWQDGSAFDSEMLTSELPAGYKAPRFYKGPVPEPPADLVFQKEPFPVAKVITTGALAVVSGALYGVAAATSGGVANATTEAELASARSTTNLLVVGSGITGAAALGAGITILVDGKSAGIGMRFRW
ncbi:MAG: hypothetical protein ACI8PZ_003399 [Myxococcota bacterium]|jgi:hypothetical protein